MSDVLTAVDASAAGLITRPSLGDVLALAGTYHVECIGPDGQVKWTDEVKNLVTDVGAKLMLDTIFGNSAAGAVYMGLKGTGAPAVGDTMASHATWSEFTNIANRVAPSFSAASGTGAGSRTKATSSATSFPINAGTAQTVSGCFIVIGGTNATGNTTGTLFSAGNFTGGDKVVSNGDTVNVTYSLAV